MKNYSVFFFSFRLPKHENFSTYADSVKQRRKELSKENFPLSSDQFLFEYGSSELPLWLLLSFTKKTFMLNWALEENYQKISLLEEWKTAMRSCSATAIPTSINRNACTSCRVNSWSSSSWRMFSFTSSSSFSRFY
jgi:hypothetical protein